MVVFLRLEVEAPVNRKKKSKRLAIFSEKFFRQCYSNARVCLNNSKHIARIFQPVMDSKTNIPMGTPSKIFF
jgi:hypothetical protein